MAERTDPRFAKALAQLRGQAVRSDGWANFFSGLGIRGRDPSLGDRVRPPEVLDRTSLEWLYRGDAIACRAVDVLPDDATRQGWRLKVEQLGGGNARGEQGDDGDRRARGPRPGDDLDPEEGNEISDGVTEYLRKLEGRRRIRKGLTLGRLFGGAIGVLGLDDGVSSNLERFALPVNEAGIKSLRWIQVLDRYQVTPGPIETNPTEPGFGEPRTYTLHGLAEQTMPVEVHSTRVIRFRGVFSPTRSGSTDNDGWDDSVLTRIWDPLSRFEMAYASAARIVRDFSRAVYAIKHLHRHIASNREDVVRRRLEIAEMSMGVLNALLIDPDGEKFEFMARPVTGLPELLDRLGMLLAAATGMPITLLLGLSPGGFGTGDDEDRRWSNVVQAYQEDHVLPAVERLVRYVLLAKDGPTGGVVPEKWSVQFHPLKAPSEKETAEIRKMVAEGWSGLVNANVLLPEEAAEGMFGSGRFGMDVSLDRDAREDLAEFKDEMREKMAEGGGPPGAGGEGGADPLQEQRDREALERNADAIMAVVRRVHDEEISAGAGAVFLNRVWGVPMEEAEALTAA